MKIDELILRINFFRQRMNISARELSLRIGKHGGYINKLECSDFNLPASVLLEIIDALNISCEEFFAENYKSHKQSTQFNSQFNSLSNENKEIVLNLLSKLH